MQKSMFWLVLLFAVILTACGDSSTKPPTDLELLSQKTEALVDSMWQEYLAASDLDQGGVLYHAQYGDNSIFATSNLAGDITSQSFFRAASITKTFTATAIMLLDERGELNIDDPICAQMPAKNGSYIPQTEDYNLPFKDQISIRMLLEHRAGVFDLTNFNIPTDASAPYAGQNWLNYVLSSQPHHFFSIDEVMAVISEHQLYQNEPGVEYSYSNTGYMLLGKIIERISEMDYESFVLQNILMPSGLNNISFPLNTAHILPEPSIPANVLYESNWIDTSEYNMSIEIAQGNLVTNSQSLLSWLMKWQRGESVLPLDTVAQMRISLYPDQSYGIGTSYSEGFGYGHTGAIAGYLTLMFYDPETDFGFVLLNNVWNMNDEEAFDEQVYTLFDIAAKAKQLITNSPDIKLPECRGSSEALINAKGWRR
jgi:D-alanyl-D-alanine carboxypeptidase